MHNKKKVECRNKCVDVEKIDILPFVFERQKSSRLFCNYGKGTI